MQDDATWMQFSSGFNREKLTPAFAPEVTVGVAASPGIRDSIHRPWVPESTYVCPGLHVYKAWKAQAICLPAVWVKLATHGAMEWKLTISRPRNLPRPRALFCFSAEYSCTLGTNSYTMLEWSFLPIFPCCGSTGHRIKWRK